jgi:hypothetical protein
MKRLWTIFLVSAAILVSTLNAQRPADAKKNNTIIWDYTVRNGTTALLDATRDTISILGASDSLYSRWFENWGGDMSLQMITSGGTTKRYRVQIQTAEGGGQAPANANFKPLYWVHYAGNGPDSAYVETVRDSIIIVGTSPSILIPPLGTDMVRIAVFSNTTQVGNTLINKWRLTRWK